MKVTREVVTDLLPAYFSGEASRDTKALVEDYFRQDPAFELMARSGATPLETLRAPVHIAAAPEKEKRDLESARWRLQWRKVLFGVSLYLTLVPLSFYSHGHVVFPMARSAPWEAAFYWSLATFFWYLYFARLSQRATSALAAIFFTLIPIPFVLHWGFAGEAVGEFPFIVWMCAAVVWIGYFRQRHC